MAPSVDLLLERVDLCRELVRILEYSPHLWVNPFKRLLEPLGIIQVLFRRRIHSHDW